MEAPEKIYIHPDIGGREFLRPWLRRAANNESIEYTRTDVIVEKASEWLRENKDKYLYNTGGKGEYIPTCSGKMIDDFRKYMKGE